jgi:hypothetical protein
MIRVTIKRWHAVQFLDSGFHLTYNISVTEKRSTTCAATEHLNLKKNLHKNGNSQGKLERDDTISGWIKQENFLKGNPYF